MYVSGVCYAYFFRSEQASVRRKEMHTSKEERTTQAVTVDSG